MGCSECYTAFADSLETLLKGMHKGTQHKGKVPPALRKAAAQKAELTRLESDLKAAIGREDFETAASLRDQIKQARKTED